MKNGKHRLVLNELKACWYRRGAVHLRIKNQFPIEIEKPLSERVFTHMKAEARACEDYINFIIESLPRINTYNRRDVNKLIILDIASRIGLKIPKTLVTTKKEIYLSTFGNNQKTITKSIHTGFDYMRVNDEGKEERYSTYTEVLDFLNLPNSFFPSKFQEKIEKEADIRVFYLFGDFYTMAIMSQDNPQTSTDFRKYDNIKPNRRFPAKLPFEVEQKLDSLMRAIELESGSIDLILTKDGEFIFLEVNPVGQFNMVSVPCNYNLEKIFAHKLKTFLS